jgi:hypothetical protein
MYGLPGFSCIARTIRRPLRKHNKPASRARGARFGENGRMYVASSKTLAYLGG